MAEGGQELFSAHPSTQKQGLKGHLGQRMSMIRKSHIPSEPDHMPCPSDVSHSKHTMELEQF